MKQNIVCSIQMKLNEFKNKQKKKGFYSLSPRNIGSMKECLLILRSTDASFTNLLYKLQS